MVGLVTSMPLLSTWVWPPELEAWTWSFLSAVSWKRMASLPSPESWRRVPALESEAFWKAIAMVAPRGPLMRSPPKGNAWALSLKSPWRASGAEGADLNWRAARLPLTEGPVGAVGQAERLGAKEAFSCHGWSAGEGTRGATLIQLMTLSLL